MGLAKHLPHYGWETIVLTPQLPEGPKPAVQILETDYQDVLGEWKSKFGLDPERDIHQQLNLPACDQAQSTVTAYPGDALA